MKAKVKAKYINKTIKIEKLYIVKHKLEKINKDLLHLITIHILRYTMLIANQQSQQSSIFCLINPHNYISKPIA